MNKYIGFDLDSKKTVACIEQPKVGISLLKKKAPLKDPRLVGLLRGVYPEQSEGLAMTISGLIFSTEH